MDRKKIDVSIVIPVFNAASYLSDCLKSVDEQEFNGLLEIILVNDGSVDGSDVLCEEYQRNSKTPVIYIRHEKNQGVSIARNSGLDSASGKYFFFLDADDVMPPMSIQKLFLAAEKNKADVTKGNFSWLAEGGGQYMGYEARHCHVYHGRDVLTVLLRHEKVRGHSCGKLFLRSVGDTRFISDLAMAEDLLFCVDFFSKSEKLVVIPDDVYEYRRHPESVTSNKYNTGIYIDWFDAVEKISPYLLNGSQKNGYKMLKIRTLFQSLNEAKRLNSPNLKKIINDIFEREKSWGLSMISCSTVFISSPKTFFRYIKYKFISLYLKTIL